MMQPGNKPEVCIYLAINKQVKVVHSNGLVVVYPELDLLEALGCCCDEGQLHNKAVCLGCLPLDEIDA